MYRKLHPPNTEPDQSLAKLFCLTADCIPDKRRDRAVAEAQALEHIDRVGLKGHRDGERVLSESTSGTAVSSGVLQPSRASPRLREVGAPGTDYRSFRLPGIRRGRSIREPRSRKSGIRFQGPSPIATRFAVQAFDGQRDRRPRRIHLARTPHAPTASSIAPLDRRVVHEGETVLPATARRARRRNEKSARWSRLLSTCENSLGPLNPR
jgi:hypothetical protein